MTNNVIDLDHHHATWVHGFHADPLSPDAACDRRVDISERGLCRLALVAAETAARFQRDGVTHDPMAWMMAPRNLFGGRPALEACTSLPEFRRALVLHGLSLGLDADPMSIDALIGGYDDGQDDDDCLLGTDHDDEAYDEVRDEDCVELRAGDPRLFTATIAFVGDGKLLHAFHASIARTAGEVAERLRRRHGRAAADHATIVSGLRLGSGFAASLVSVPLATMLRDIASDPGSPLAAGLNLDLEQRFDA